MKLQKKYVGKIFGKLTIIDQIPGKKSICKCECGNTKIIATSNLRLGNIFSCGCLRSINRENYDQDMKNKLLSRIDIKDNGCWEWKGAKHRQGYGNIGYKRKVCLAHRISWKLFRGDLRDDILVLHKCDNPPCINPDHLFLGSDRDNVLDSISKGRFYRAKGKDHYFSRFSNEQIKEIRKLSESGITYDKIAKLFDSHKATICHIVKRKSWKHL
ncbi:MAG: hypothetical protein EHM34_00045 [Nitrosopumilales archaeon]|nr:MAG: hypothetical protein EHM34_02415 [Nitrosopumilales archaeon]RPI86205.1 MAG: hypothetical protein EHM34_00045 [Nitrosopumilales archaeon]